MQLRELLKSQQALNPMIANKTNLNDQLDAFKDVLTQKKTDVNTSKQTFGEVEKPKFTLSANKPAYVGRVETDDKVQASDGKAQQVEKPQQNDQSQQKQPVKKVSKDENTEVEDSEALKDEVKEKLKAKTNMTEDQINEILAMMNLTVDDLKEMVNSSEGVTKVIEMVQDVIDTLEIDSQLETSLSNENVNSITNDLTKMLENLENLTQPQTTEGEPNFEQKLIQTLSEVVSQLSELSDDTVPANEVRKLLVDAISKNKAETKVIEGVTVQKDVQTTDAIKETKVQAQDLITVESDQNPVVEDQDAVQSSGQVKPVSAEGTPAVKEQVNTQVEVQSEQVITSDDAGISIHQVIMKQGNNVTVQQTTVQQIPKQEIFSQILEAVKAQVKLSDHGSSMIVKLQPEQLGNVELKLNIQKGVVLAELKVENEIVKAAIESNLDDLKQSLNNKGYSINQINVNIDSGKREGQAGFDLKGQKSSKKNNQENASVDALEPLEQISRYELNELDGSTFNYYG